MKRGLSRANVYRNEHTQIHIQGVQEKLCFFTIPCNPSLAVRDLQSSQRNASVQSLLLAGNFFCSTNSSLLLARERWQTFENSLKKNSIFNEHPVTSLHILEIMTDRPTYQPTDQSTMQTFRFSRPTSKWRPFFAACCELPLCHTVSPKFNWH